MIGAAMTLFQKKRLSARAAMLLEAAAGLASTSASACNAGCRAPQSHFQLSVQTHAQWPRPPLADMTLNCAQWRHRTSHMHSCILCKPTRLLQARTRFLQARVIPASARGSCKRTRVLASTLTCACSVRSRWYAKNTLRPVPVGLSASVRYANSLQRHSSREEIRTAQDTAL